MTRNFLSAFLAIVALSVGALGQTKQLNTAADPFGLKMVGLGERVKAYPIVPVAPADDVLQPRPHQSCGDGVSYRISNISTHRGPKEVKIVVLTYKPKFDTGHTPEFDKLSQSKSPDFEYIPAIGYGSISFGWPPQLRTPQFVRLQWTGKNENGELLKNSMELLAEIDLRESDKQSISWKLDSYLTPIPATDVEGRTIKSDPAEVVGRPMKSDPLLFYVTLTKAAKKCLSK